MLDTSIRRCTRRAGRPTSSADAELHAGRRPRPRRLRRARWTASTRSSTSPPRSASASRCTRSSATSRSTRSAAPCCSRRSSSAATRSAKLLVASSHVDLRRGPVRRTPRRARPASRPACGPRASWPGASGSCSPTTGTPLEPEPTAETKPLRPTSVYAVTKRDHEELCLAVGAAYGIPDGRAALLQRLRRAAGALEPVHRRRRDLRLAPAERPAAARLRGRAPDARLHRRPRHRARLLARAHDSGRRRRGGQPRHRRRRPPCSTSRTCSRAGSARRSSPSCPASTARATSATASPTRARARELLGFETEIAFEDGMRDLLEWLEGQEASDARGRRRRGARRARPRALSVALPTSPSPSSTPRAASCCSPASPRSRET